ncbi:unnamed protein product (macronuclear) [Paramecium tetraurelia]|uniref:Rab-GAP TBC domain-containing protein n=1 Tax=Paramecium tetraurelia TaxID=5888 RepID=A0EDM3_PARTE|nr:uncharacterized protein GSPATT00025734001 [Paramecium tetraurelia]CAK93390.1 unnamed protein product [Paramecium tetraurelia]|eukprot:XP_001460787.1 hypothetical protein (macronuclear) [Paramecium tetraurelia strain d4-2]
MNNNVGEEDDDLLISGARNNKKGQINLDLSNYSSNIPDIIPAFDLNNFKKYILNENLNLNEIQELILNCHLSSMKLRFSIWRLFLGIFKISDSLEEKINKLNQNRSDYQNLSKQYLQVETKKESKRSVRNPLLQNQQEQQKQNVWNNFFEINHLKSEIKKDVDRTHQDKQLFQSLKIKNLLSNILFIWSVKNPTISYRQGMNELAANVIEVYFTETQGFNNLEDSDDKKEIAIFFDTKYAEEDIFQLFEQIMVAHVDMFKHTPESQKKQQLIIQNRIQKIYDQQLKIIDITLFKHLKVQDVELSVFLVRWIRCMFTREFHVEDSLKVWDAIFYDYYLTEDKQWLILVDCIVIAMFVYVRDQILEKDDPNACLKRFLKYPPVENLAQLIQAAFSIKNVLQSANPEQTLLQDQFLITFLGSRDVSQSPKIFQNVKNPEIPDENNKLIEANNLKQQETIEVQINQAQLILKALNQGIVCIQRFNTDKSVNEVKQLLENAKSELLKCLDQQQN